MTFLRCVAIRGTRTKRRPGNSSKQALGDRGERPAERPSGAACAKRPHGRLRRLSAELENVGEASDFLADFLADFLEKLMLHFGKIPKILVTFAKIQQNSGKILAKFAKF